MPYQNPIGHRSGKRFQKRKEAIRFLASQLVEMIDNGPRSGLTCIKTLLEEDIKEERKGIKICCTYCCQHPEKLKGTPEECTTEQIRECHGNTEEHPCTEEKKE